MLYKCSLSRALIIVSLIVTTAAQQQFRRRQKLKIRAAVILPSAIRVAAKCASENNGARSARKCPTYLATIENVTPMLQYAKEDMAQKYSNIYADADWLQVVPCDLDSCDQKQTAHTLLTANDASRVTVIFGPVCDYAAATALRIASHYRTPLLTPGGFNFPFEDKKEYPTLTRVGLSTRTLYTFLDRFARNFGWRQFFYGYQTDFDLSEVLGQDFCKLLGNGFYERMTKAYNISIKHFNEKVQFRQFLIDEIGFKYAGVVIIQNALNYSDEGCV